MKQEASARARRPSFVTTALAVLVTTFTWLAVSTPAHATCYSSTPTSATFTDAAADAPVAPDILQVDAALDGGCGFAINPTVNNAPYAGLVSGDAVFTYVNADGNALTGDTLFGGADRVVGVLGPSGSGPPVLGIWNGVDFTFTQALAAVGVAGFSTTLNQLGVPAPTTLGVKVGTIYTDGVATDIDVAPDGPGTAYGFPVSFSTTAPLPPPPPPPPVIPAALPPAPAAVQVKKCTVPNVKGQTVSKARDRLKKAGCKYKIKGAGKVTSLTPAAGTRTSGTVQLKAKKKRKRGSHAARLASELTTLRSMDRAIHKAAAGRDS
jgi:hypothetical protein